MKIHTSVSPSLSEALTGCTVDIFSSHPETTGKNDFLLNRIIHKIIAHGQELTALQDRCFQNRQPHTR